MISIETRRVGLLVIAITVHDDLSVTTAVGLTKEHASRRLVRGLG